MRPAMAMIELIFAIVIIAISVMTIPSMMSIAAQASKGMAIDDDVMSRLSGWTLDKFQARWDDNYEISDSRALNIAAEDDLNCSRNVAGLFYRVNLDTNTSCNMALAPSAIPAPGSGILANGIEQLNNGSEPITIAVSTGESYDITATYRVTYVSSTVTPLIGSSTQTATWVLGSSTAMAPSASGTSHLKRVVTRFNNTALGVDATLTFFKSNKGN